MEFFHSFQTTVLAAILALVIVVYLLWTTTNGKKKAEKTRAPPEAAGAWPIIGHLLLLRGPRFHPRVLAAMADKFGPIFTVKLGSHQALVVSNWEMAKECFTTNDAVFANRPKSMAAELMCYNYALFSLAPSGPYWRQLIKIATLKLLSNRRIELLGHIRRSEVRGSIRQLYDLWAQNKREKVLVDMKKWFEKVTLNITLRMVAGKRYSGEEEEEEAVRYKKAMKGFFEMILVFPLSDLFPCLRWLDLGGYEKAMKRTRKEIDDILESWLNEHKQKRDSGKVKEGEQDFMDVMLDVLDDDSPTTGNSLGYDADTINKSTC